MDYKEFIQNIINTRGRFNCGEEYHERHHIIPRCMGGTNDKENLIDLYAHEHYIAHKLLALENIKNQKLQYAWWQMCHCKRDGRFYEVSAEDYELAKKLYSQNMSVTSKENWQDPIIRNKRESALSTDAVRHKMSESAKNRYNTPEGKSHIDNMWTPERLKKISKIVLQISKDGDILNEFCSAREAARQLNIYSSSIIECCNNKRKTAGGYIWKYKS